MWGIIKINNKQQKSAKNGLFITRVLMTITTIVTQKCTKLRCAPPRVPKSSRLTWGRKPKAKPKTEAERRAERDRKRQEMQERIAAKKAAKAAAKEL